MRTREKFLDDYEREYTGAESVETMIAINGRYTIDLLLDIRDLLTKDK